MIELYFVLAGFVSGVVGGMGMGGGTVLIPVLTLLLHSEQKNAQGTNLLVFIPTALVAAFIYAKKGLVDKRVVLLAGIPALISSLISAWCVGFLPQNLLHTYFGWFLCVFGTVSLLTVLLKKV